MLIKRTEIEDVLTNTVFVKSDKEFVDVVQKALDEYEDKSAWEQARALASSIAQRSDVVREDYRVDHIDFRALREYASSVTKMMSSREESLYSLLQFEVSRQEYLIQYRLLEDLLAKHNIKKLTLNEDERVALCRLGNLDRTVNISLHSKLSEIEKDFNEFCEHLEKTCKRNSKVESEIEVKTESRYDDLSIWQSLTGLFFGLFVITALYLFTK